MVLRQRAVSEDASGRFSEYSSFGVVFCGWNGSRDPALESDLHDGENHLRLI